MIKRQKGSTATEKKTVRLQKESIPAKRLERIRIRIKLKQVEMAENLGCTLGALEKWERSNRERSDFSIIYYMAYRYLLIEFLREKKKNRK